MTSLPAYVRAALALVLLAGGIALLLVGQPSPALLGLAALWLAGLLAQSFRRGGNGRADVASTG